MMIPVCDISGAWVLAKELRMTQAEIDSINAFDGLEAAPERVKKDQKTVRLGFWLLAIGFILQAASTMVSFWDI